LGIDQNEWRFLRATWSEVLVQNTLTGAEVWIPRRFLGEASRIDEPVVIIGLVKELEYKGGMVSPHERRVLEIPRGPNASTHPEDAGYDHAPAPPRTSPMRLEGGAESRVGKMLVAAVAIGILACLIVVFFLRDSATRVTYTAVMQNDLGFTANDDYFSIVNRLGKPSEDRWRSDQGEMQFRLLRYPQQGMYVVLMGPDRKDVHYIGAVDQNWRVVHATNEDTRSMLRKLKKF
jgi:hypothetical protein